MNANLHDTDFYAWTQQQTRLLKSGKLSEIDIEHLIEEIESMGASERRELINRLGVLLAHLLKWQYQPSYRGRSWQLTIKEQRRQLARLLKDNPSFQAKLMDFIPEAYEDALILAAKETGLDENYFPGQCAYALKDVLDFEFIPGGN